MAYIGNRPEQGNFRKCDAITTSATATYNLLVGGVAVNPNQNQCIVSLNGVIQSSGNSYTIASSQITFASALTSSDVIDFILILGDTLDVGVPSDDTVSTAKIQANAVTNAKLGSDINATKLTAGLVPTARLGSGTASSSTFLRGDQTYAEAGGGEYVKIANNSGTNSVGGAFINDCFSTTYRTYLVTFQFENDRNGNQIWLRWLADDDSTFNSNYRYACHQTNNGGTESTRVATGDSKWLMTGGTAGGNTAIFGGCFGYMYVHNPYTIASGQAGAGNKYRVGWNAHYNEYDDSGNVVNSNCTGMLEQNDYNVAGIQFMPSANYIAKRNITVWGLKEY